MGRKAALPAAALLACGLLARDTAFVAPPNGRVQALRAPAAGPKARGAAEFASAERSADAAAFSAPVMPAAGVLAVLATLAAERRTRVALSARGGSGGAAATGGSMQDDTWSEVAALERAAEQLKADVAKMELELERQRDEQQQKLFNAFDLDGSGAIDAKELQVGLQESLGLKVDESYARRILQSQDKDSDGVLKFEEFNLQRLERSLDDLKQQDWEAEMSERKLKREVEEKKAEEQEIQKMIEQYYENLPPANEDKGALTRIASVLVYALPLLDGLRGGLQMSVFAPEAQSAIQLLVDGPLRLMDGVWFGQILVFLLFQSQANNVELPVLLRYNMRQAVVLDMAVGLLHLTEALALSAYFGEGPEYAVALHLGNAFLFTALLGCVAYIATKSAGLGELPNEIPWISGYTERYFAPTRASDFDPADVKKMKIQFVQQRDEAAKDEKPEGPSSK